MRGPEGREHVTARPYQCAPPCGCLPILPYVAPPLVTPQSGAYRRKLEIPVSHFANIRRSDQLSNTLRNPFHPDTCPRHYYPVLGAEALTVADAAVTKHRDFASISVTAEKWLPINEVSLSGEAG